MKFIATTSDKIKDISIVSGQLIFSRDDRVIYLDSGKERTSFQQILSVPTEEFRLELTFPIQGFYFVEDTKILWRYQNGAWLQVTEPPKESVVFLSQKDFPEQGKEGILYVDGNSIYRWNDATQNYSQIGAGGETLNWGAII